MFIIFMIMPHPVPIYIFCLLIYFMFTIFMIIPHPVPRKYLTLQKKIIKREQVVTEEGKFL